MQVGMGVRWGFQLLVVTSEIQYTTIKLSGKGRQLPCCAVHACQLEYSVTWTSINCPLSSHQSQALARMHSCWSIVEVVFAVLGTPIFSMLYAEKGRGMY